MSNQANPWKIELAASFDYYGTRLSWAYEDIIRQLGPQTWTGPAAERFETRMRQFKGQIDGLMPLYRQTAANIRARHQLPPPTSHIPRPMPSRGPI